MTDLQSPKTPGEWQAAVDAACAFLRLESARLYGLVTGLPPVDVARCGLLAGRTTDLAGRPPGAVSPSFPGR